MKNTRLLLISFILLVFITGCNSAAKSTPAPESLPGNLVGNWETRRILANGYYSEFLNVELVFNKDGSCQQISTFESSGGQYQLVNCHFKIDNDLVEITFDNQVPLKAYLAQDELTLAHPYGVATGSGSPQTFARVSQTSLEN
jgi:hypothetical protein